MTRKARDRRNAPTVCLSHCRTEPNRVSGIATVQAEEKGVRETVQGLKEFAYRLPRQGGNKKVHLQRGRKIGRKEQLDWGEFSQGVKEELRFSSRAPLN